MVSVTRNSTRAAQSQPASSPAAALPPTPHTPLSSHPASDPNGKTEQGLVTITGVAVLENPRIPDSNKPRSLIFDCSFSLGANNPPLTACLRYFNSKESHLSFKEGHRDKYVICVSVAQPTEKAEICSSTQTWEDYDLIGDIIWIVCARNAQADQHPVFDICGSVQEIQEKIWSFKVLAHQYTQQLGGRGQFLAQVKIPDTPRFRDSKPMPQNTNTYVSVVGQLTHVERSSTMRAQLFHIDLQNVVYHPRYAPVPVYNPTTPPPPTQRRGRQLIFEDVADDDIEEIPEKRPRLDDSGDETSTLRESPMSQS